MINKIEYMDSKEHIEKIREVRKRQQLRQRLRATLTKVRGSSGGELRRRGEEPSVLVKRIPKLYLTHNDDDDAQGVFNHGAPIMNH